MLNKTRKYERKELRFPMKIYSQICKGNYTVEVKNIAKGGAFILGNKPPSLGEIISFELIDDTYRPFHYGQARVCRLEQNVSKEQRGFGVMFLSELSDELYSKLIKNFS